VIETILILPEIPVRILLEIKGVVGACDRGFQVAKDRIDPGKAVHLCAFSFADDVPVMNAAGLFYSREAGKTV
jgi:hypothetical protein